MTNKQLAKELRNIGEALWTKTFDPNFKLLLDEASERLEQVEAETAKTIIEDIDLALEEYAWEDIKAQLKRQYKMED